MTRTSPRRGRIRPAAAVALMLSTIVVALALWGLLRSTVPAAADFGSRTPATPSVAPDAAADVPAAASAGDGAAAATGGTRVVIEPPQTRPATLDATREERVEPVRLRVPSLGLDVPLDAVGVRDDGQMEIPEDADRAGWYRFGPVPGADTGSVVIAGHVDDRSGPGAFLALTQAQEGSEVLVELADGTELRYTVTAREQIAKPELPVADLFDRDGPPLLRLVTCTGEWSSAASSYTDNLVLTAEPEQR